MRFISLLTFLFVLTGCASSPTPKTCSAKWDQLDEGILGPKQVKAINEVIHPNEETYLDRDCAKLSKVKGKAIIELVNLTRNSRSEFDGWTSEEKENKANLEDEDQDYVEDYKRNQKNSENQPIPYSVTETKQRIDDLLQKLKAFKNLKTQVKLAGREAQYLIPIQFTRAKDWLRLETIEKDERAIKKLTQHIENKEKTRIAKDASQKAYTEEMNKFLINEFQTYKLSKEEFNMDVVQSNGVDNYGSSLGQTIFKFSKSRVFDIEKFKKSGTLFEISLLNKSNKERIAFNFKLLKNYVVLENAKIGNETLTEIKAMHVLSLALH